MKSSSPAQNSITESHPEIEESTIRLVQTLTEQELREAAWSHLSTYWWTKWRPVLAFIGIVGVSPVWFFEFNQPIGVLLFVLSLYVGMGNRLYVRRFMKRKDETHLLNNETEVNVSETKVQTKSEIGEG